MAGIEVGFFFFSRFRVTTDDFQMIIRMLLACWAPRQLWIWCHLPKIRKILLIILVKSAFFWTLIWQDIIIFLLYSVIVKNVKSSFDLLDTKEYQKPSVRDLNFIQHEGKHLWKKDLFAFISKPTWHPTAKSMTKKWKMIILNKVWKKEFSLLLYLREINTIQKWHPRRVEYNGIWKKTVFTLFIIFFNPVNL